MKYSAVKGMSDILPGEVEKWQYLEKKSRVFFDSRGYKEIRTPILESTDLFQRSIGEATDIVHKQMYAFQDRGGRSLTLRPEMTASVARSLIENKLLKHNSVLYLYYMGPMFRAERPQAGRKRQFHQVGVELINQDPPDSDSDIIALLYDYFKYIGLNEFTIKLNNLGCEKDRKKYSATLKDYFEKSKGNLCEDCNYRLERNVLRILDCKEEKCRKIIENVPTAELCDKCEDIFNRIKGRLTDFYKIPYVIDKRLVRGLDYYTGCVFEVVGKGLGAQDAIAAGGRYDDLIKFLGGPESKATGFSVGVERTLLALEASGFDFNDYFVQNTVYIANLDKDKESLDVCRKISLILNEAGRKTELSLGDTSLSSHLKKANKLGLKQVIIVGKDEISRGEFSLKNLDTGEQKPVKQEDILSIFRG